MPSKKRSTPSSSKNISIGRDAVNSVIIAGDNNVVNYFSGEYVSFKEHYIPPDSVFQRVRTEDFVGRDWLTVQVDAFLNDPQRKSGAFLLIGDAGVGKTSFMAHLVKERRYLHLFAEQVPGQAMLQRAIQSLGSQLVTRYQIDPYKDRDTLIQGTVFPDFLERLLRMAASKLTGGEKIVIVCDALDEAGTFPDGNVFGLPNVLPDGVYLILSQRPVNVKLPNLEPLTVRLEAQGVDNLQDMEKYLRAVAQRASVADQLRAKNYSDAFFIQTLKEKSLGVWMYLHYVIKEIEQGSRTPLELGELPTGLVGYYADFWGDWRMGRKGRGEGERSWNALYAPLLTTLAAAQEAIPIRTLIQWAEVDADEDEVTRLVAEEWRAFIEEKEAGAETRYKPYHLSFADFIAGRADHEKLPPAQKNLVRDLAKRTVKAHQRIVKVFEAECNGQWDKLVEREYPRLHLSAHLNGAGEYETLRILLTEGHEKIQWAEAREQKEETYAGYLNDLTYVWAYAEREQNYALAIRCMLIENSIHSLAVNISPNLLSQLAKSGLWSYPRCLSTIRENSNSRTQAESLKLLIPNLPPLLLQDALTIACEIKKEYARASTLASLVPHLNNELKSQALAAARKIKDESARARALTSLTPYLNDELKLHALQESLAATRDIKDKSERASALVTLAPHLNDKLKSQVLQEAFAATCEIKDKSERASALTDLAPHLDEKSKSRILQEAIATACEILDEDIRIRALMTLTPYLNNNLKTLVVTAVYNIKKEIIRARALADIALHLNEDIKSQALPEALAAAREIKDESDRARILVDIAQHLNEDIKSHALQEALAAAREIKDESDRARILADISQHLNEDIKSQALQEAFAAARQIKEGIVVNSRTFALTHLASCLHGELKIQVLQEAITAAHEIKDGTNRIRALSSLVPYLNEECKAEAFAAACQIKYEFDRTHALALLVPYLNDASKLQALAAAREIKEADDRVYILSALAPYLSDEFKSRALQEALASVREIRDDVFGSRTNALANVVLHLSEEGKSQAIAAACEIKNEQWRVQALIALAPHLNDELKSQVLQKALAEARETKDEYCCASVLANLAFHLNNELKSQALATAREIEDERWRTHALANIAPHLNDELKYKVLQEALAAAQRIKNRQWRIGTLSSLIPYMDDELKYQTIQEALATVRETKDEDVRAYVLSVLTPHLNDKLKSQVLATIREIEDEGYRTKALETLTLHLNDENKSQALAIAHEIKDEGYRVHALMDLLLYLNDDLKSQTLSEILYSPGINSLGNAFNIWKDIEYKGLLQELILFIQFISKRDRKNGVEIVGILAPALIHFSGEEIVPELYRAIQDTARWWP